MDRFNAQTLAKAGATGKTVEMIFEDDKRNQLSLSVPTPVALALIPVLEGLKASASPAGKYAKMAEEWRTAHDLDSRHVVLEIKGSPIFVFPLEGAKALWQQLKGQCDEIDGRGDTKVQ